MFSLEKLKNLNSAVLETDNVINKNISNHNAVINNNQIILLKEQKILNEKFRQFDKTLKDIKIIYDDFIKKTNLFFN